MVEIGVGLTDNENLKQVRVSIATAFAKSFGNWKDLEVRDISGTTYQGTFSFLVPDTARAGYYQVSVRGRTYAEMEQKIQQYTSLFCNQDLRR